MEGTTVLELSESPKSNEVAAPPMSTPREASVESATRKLQLAIVLCVLFVSGEMLGGYLSGSLAIMSDAAHMLSDLASFCVSLTAIYLGRRRPSARFTFGYYRAEALGALLTIVLLWYVTGVLIYLALHRIRYGEFEVEPDAMLVVAVCAVVFNIVLGLLLVGVPHVHGHGHSHGTKHTRMKEDDEHEHKAKHQHLNVRAAAVHVLGDLLQSLGVLCSSLLIKFFPHLKLADPICTLVFSFIVFATTFTVLRDTVHILMEGVPAHINLDDVSNALSVLDGVKDVKQLRLWALTSDLVEANVHLSINDPDLINQARIGVESVLRERFGVKSCTVQIELEQKSRNNDA